MSPTRIVAFGLACLLAGLLAGYLFWGLPTRGLENGLREAQNRLGVETARADQVEDRLKQAEARLEQLTADLKSERELRQKFELLISRGRK